MGSQPPLGIHLLWHGVLHGLQVDISSTINLHGLQGDSLPHHGLHHGLQGNLCSGAWSTSSPSFFTGLGVCRVVSLTYSHSSLQLQLHRFFPPLLQYVIPEALPPSLMGSALASGRSVLQPAGIGSIRLDFPNIEAQRVFFPMNCADANQDFALLLAELCEIPLSPFLKAVKVPLNGSTTLWCISRFLQVCIICKLNKDALCPITQMLNSIGPSTDVWGALLVIDFQLNLVLLITTLLAQEHAEIKCEPVPMLDNPFREVKFPNIQSKPPLAQLEVISSCPITCYHLGEETDPHLSTTSFQVVVESHKVSPQPPFLQAKQPQFPQPLLIRLLLQTLHQLRCPSLHTLQHLNVSLVVRGPTLNTGFEVWAHQCRVQGDDRIPSPAGHAISDTSQGAIGFLGHLGTLLAHIQPAVNQHARVLFHQAAFQRLFPKPVALHGVAVAQVQDLALGLVEPHTIGLGPSIQPVQVPLQSLPALKQINTPTQLGVICKLAEGALDPLVQIIDKDIKQNWPQK
ncbi:hypothetical protein QYF61_006144 [Mycteria americana]|uniref:Uncharacterized protein n=1 Tax=Mycteria americana TaxID=33587 RepID=A0AAN7NHQ8_MYCAM|nr:hypothetical protein QYF61_006144 [Mycteria americana]